MDTSPSSRSAASTTGCWQSCPVWMRPDRSHSTHQEAQSQNRSPRCSFTFGVDFGPTAIGFETDCPSPGLAKLFCRPSTTRKANASHSYAKTLAECEPKRPTESNTSSSAQPSVADANQNLSKRQGNRLAKTLSLPPVQRQEIDWQLEELERWTKRMNDLEVIIINRCQGDAMVDRIRTIPGCAHYSALSLVCRVGDLIDFPKARASLTTGD